MRSSRELLCRQIQTCTDLKSITQIHSFLLKTGLLTSPDCFLATKLTISYSNFASFTTAHKLFVEIPHPNTHLFNFILRCHSKSQRWHQILHLFKHIPNPDSYTFPLALKASANLFDLNYGRAIHGHIITKTSFAGSDLFVGSALVEFYAKCGLMGDARKVFEGFRDPDVVLWTLLLTGYQQNGDAEEAVAFFSRMLVENAMVPDPVAVMSLVSAVGQLGDVGAAKCCHGYVTRMGIGSNLKMANAVLNLYSKLGDVKSAEGLFRVMDERDLISWSCMIACYAHNGRPVKALEVHGKMVEMGLEPNEVTVIGVIQACTLACDLQHGRRMHELAVRKGFELDDAVSTSLTNMYMKCSCYSEAMDIFFRMPKKDAVAWAAVIGGCSQIGFANESPNLFITMLAKGVRPDAVTMVKILAACSELGMLRQAHCFHGFLVRSGFDNNTFVIAALIDLYSKCGSLEEAVKVFDIIDVRDVVLWSSMIAGYGFHGLGSKAIQTFQQMVDSSVRPNNVTFISLLSACSHAGLATEGKSIFGRMSKVYGVVPDSEHCAIMVDLLGRTGELREAVELIEEASGSVGPHVWCSLLAGCKTHHNTELGGLVGRNLLSMEPDHAGYYNLLSNMYAFDGMWSNVAEIRGLLRERGLRKTPGYSSVEVAGEVHTFLSGERLHRDSKSICEALKKLELEMRADGYVRHNDDTIYDLGDGMQLVTRM